jgi:oxygen-independent coproporphyrinogen-3 oxidase
MKRTNWFEEEILTSKERWNEFILTRLRTIKGINLTELKDLFTLDKNFTVTKQKFVNQNWLIEENNFLKLSLEGQLRADYLASEFFKI